MPEEELHRLVGPPQTSEEFADETVRSYPHGTSFDLTKFPARPGVEVQMWTDANGSLLLVSVNKEQKDVLDWLFSRGSQNKPPTLREWLRLNLGI